MVCCRFLRTVLCVGLMFLTACGGGRSDDGGGTSGSGVINTQKVIVEGTIQDSNGKPIPDATVQVEGDSNIYQTDQNGKFVFESDLDKKNLQIVFTKDNSSSQLNVEIIPNQDNAFSLNVVLGEGGDFEIQNNSNDAGKTCPTTSQGGGVCGADGRTYLNECYADSAGVKVEHKGKCDLSKDCNYDSVCDLVDCGSTTAVCGKDSKTYSSAESAHLNGIGVAYHRACIEKSYLDFYTSCSLFCYGSNDASEQVCGVDGRIYASECRALTSGVNIQSFDSCELPEVCDPDPVCGVYTNCRENGEVCDYDGNTYQNAEEAKLYGNGIAYHRACLGQSEIKECKLKCIKDPPISEAVCGKDGVTYASECVAMVTGGVDMDYSGPCQIE